MPEQRKHVLIVDDDLDTRALLGSRLDRHALTMDLASSGREALDLIQHTNYAVVLLNFGMPGINDLALLERLSTTDGSAPVVLVMTSVDRSELESLDPNRIHGVLRKPVDPDEVVALVRECAEIKSRGVFGTMAIASVVACGPMLGLLKHLAQ